MLHKSWKLLLSGIEFRLAFGDRLSWTIRFDRR